MTCAELAQNLRRAQELLTPQERKGFARAVQAARVRMGHEHLR